MGTKANPYAGLKYPDFRYFLLSKVLLTIAFQIQAVIVGWQIYDITHDPLSLGLIGLVEVIPNFSITLFAGHFADIYDRKKIVFSCLAILIFSGLGLFGASHFFESEDSKVHFLYLSIALTGLARGVLGPSLFSIMTECVEKEHYVNSTAWHSSLWQIAFMLGSGSSGFLFARFGHYSYLIATFFIVGAAILFSFISPKPHQNKSNTAEMIETNIFVSIKSGINYVFKNEVILGALSLDLFAVLFGGAVALLPIFAKDILQVGPEGLGFLKAAPSIGSAIMAIILLYFPPIHNTGKKLLFAVFGFGICMLVFGFSTHYYLSLFALMLSGAFDNVSVVVRGTIMQTLVPLDMKGKVYSVNSLFIGSSNEIGAFESGVMARIMGVAPSVVFGGIMTLGVVFFTSWRFKKLTKLNFSDNS